MGKVRVEILQKMLQLISNKTGLAASMKNLNAISERIPGVGDSYLYKKIHSQISKKKKGQYIGLRVDQLDSVARFLGYDDFNSMSSAFERKDDPQLESLTGAYYCYVRRNAKNATILRSPVRISKEKGGRILFELKGPSHVFTGEVQKRHGCLFVLIDAKGGKSFYHVYKIGERIAPEVLQGIFAGVSTAFDPIGGRVVLIRSPASYVSLTNKSLDTVELKISPLTGEKKLAQYFKEYFNNNLAPNRAATFDIEDLE